jgi:hypothetical protein
LITKGLTISIIVGVVAAIIFGFYLISIRNANELPSVDGPSLSILTDKIDFKKGEIIEIRIINTGTIPITFSDSSYGLKIRGLDGTIIYSPVSAQVISVLEPKEEKVLTWDQLKNDQSQVLEGTYKITVSGSDENGNTLEKSLTIHILK